MFNMAGQRVISAEFIIDYLWFETDGYYVSVLSKAEYIYNNTVIHEKDIPKIIVGKTIIDDNFIEDIGLSLYFEDAELRISLLPDDYTGPEALVIGDKADGAPWIY